MNPRWNVPGVEAAWCAARIGSGAVLGNREDEPVTPASVMKIQVALATASAIEKGELDGSRRVTLRPDHRTPGPVGMSLLSDTVALSVRDLLPPMLTISDNVATDAALDLVGLDAVNALTRKLGLSTTVIASDLSTMLDELARECGFADYAHLSRHDPDADGPPTNAQVRTAIAGSAALDPARGSRTTAVETVRLLRCLWDDTAGPAGACATVRGLMACQLTRNRIASGFGPGWSVAAKSGGLMGLVRNEAAVVTAPDGASFAVAIFTRIRGDGAHDPADIDAAIGGLARGLVDRLR